MWTSHGNLARLEMTESKQKPGKTPRRRRRKDARPAEIIEAGLREFAEKGYAGTRLDDVAARAGIVKGTIYLYFPNKAALFKEAVRSRIIPTLGQIEAMIDTYPGSSQDLLEHIFRTIYARLIDSDLRGVMRIMITEGNRFPEIAEFYYRESLSKALALLDKVVARGLDRGDIRAGPASEYPRIIMAPAILASIWKMTFDRFDPIDLDRFIAAHLDLVFNGISSHPPPERDAER